MERALETLGKGQKAIEGWTQLTGTLAMEKSLLTDGMKRAKKLLRDNPFSVPPTKDDRRLLLDLANAVSNVGIAQLRSPPTWDPEVAEEKFGYVAERLFANPFIQDQLLRNPVKWTKTVEFGKHVLVENPSSADAEYRREAMAFIRSYEPLVKECKEELDPVGIVIGVGADQVHIRCPSSKTLYLSHKTASKP